MRPPDWWETDDRDEFYARSKKRQAQMRASKIGKLSSKPLAERQIKRFRAPGKGLGVRPERRDQEDGEEGDITLTGQRDHIARVTGYRKS